MSLFYLLAQTQPAVPAQHGTMPDWLSYILGPLGALVLLCIYALYTEKRRLPQYSKIIDGLKAELVVSQKQTEAAQQVCKDEMEALRKRYESREDALENRIEEWRDRHTKEKAVRAWYQAKAHALAEDAGEKLGPPPDIDRTHYGSGE